LPEPGPRSAPGARPEAATSSDGDAREAAFGRRSPRMRWPYGAVQAAPARSFLQRLVRREEDNVADRPLPCEQHDQAINTHSEPAGRRHAMLQREDEVLIDELD